MSLWILLTVNKFLLVYGVIIEKTKQEIEMTQQSTKALEQLTESIAKVMIMSNQKLNSHLQFHNFREEVSEYK